MQKELFPQKVKGQMCQEFSFYFQKQQKKESVWFFGLIIMSSLFGVIYIFVFKVCGKEKLNHGPLPISTRNKINKNSQIIETIFTMRFTEAVIIGSFGVSVFLARMIQQPQACNQLKATEKQAAGLDAVLRMFDIYADPVTQTVDAQAWAETLMHTHTHIECNCII